METPEWIAIGICAVGVVAHLVWFALSIAKMSKELERDEENEDGEIH